MIRLAGPLAVSPMQAASYAISGVPSFPERKDHLTEFGYGMLDKVGNEVITDEEIGVKAQKENLLDIINLLTQKDIFTYNKGGVVHANVGGYAEEPNPIVSLAGEYAETTPMPAPDYANIELPQNQGGGGSSTGNMAKNMAMKMGMKMAANALFPGSGMIFNKGGHVPKGPMYAEEGLTPYEIEQEAIGDYNEAILDYVDSYKVMGPPAKAGSMPIVSTKGRVPISQLAREGNLWDWKTGVIGPLLKNESRRFLPEVVVEPSEREAGTLRESSIPSYSRDTVIDYPRMYSPPMRDFPSDYPIIPSESDWYANKGGHVPLYADIGVFTKEGLTSDELFNKDLRLAKEGLATDGWNYPYKKHLNPEYDPSIIHRPYGDKWGYTDTDILDFPRWMSIPEEMREEKINEEAWDYARRRRDERMEVLPEAELEDSSLEPLSEVDTWIAPPSLGGDYPYKSSLREGWGVPVIDPTEEQYEAEILRKQKHLEDLYKEEIEKGKFQKDGLSYANRGGYVGPPMTKEYIRKLMS